MEVTFDVVDLLLCNIVIFTFRQSITEKNKSRRGTVNVSKIFNCFLMSNSESVKLFE